MPDYEYHLATTHDAYDLLEELEPTPENEYREASRKMLQFLFSIVDFLASYKNLPGLEYKFWSVAAALQHPCVDGVTDRFLSEMLGCTRANMSKHILDFERRVGLPPGLGQKRESARAGYAKAHLDGRAPKRSADWLKGLNRTLEDLAKLAERYPVSEWPEVERDVLAQKVELLSAILEK